MERVSEYDVFVWRDIDGMYLKVRTFSTHIGYRTEYEKTGDLTQATTSIDWFGHDRKVPAGYESVPAHVKVIREVVEK